MDASPTAVLITTGKNAIKKAISTFGNKPKPNHTRNSGATATLGMAWEETRSGRIEREKTGERKIANASGMPMPMLKANPSRISSVVIQPCERRRKELAANEAAMALGGGSRKAGTANNRVAISHSAST